MEHLLKEALRLSPERLITGTHPALQPPTDKELSIHDAGLGAVQGEPGKGMSFGLGEMIQNHVEANPETATVETIVIDKGESWTSNL